MSSPDAPSNREASPSTEVRYQSELLADRHQLDSFSSSNAELDDWLIHHARRAAAINTGRTFVWHAGDDRVVAHFALAAHRVRRTQIAPISSGFCSAQAPSTIAHGRSMSPNECSTYSMTYARRIATC